MTGWRTFDVDWDGPDGPELRSPVHGVEGAAPNGWAVRLPWQAASEIRIPHDGPVLRAICPMPWPDHEPPGPDCVCGLHLCRDWRGLTRYWQHLGALSRVIAECQALEPMVADQFDFTAARCRALRVGGVWIHPEVTGDLAAQLAAKYEIAVHRFTIGPRPVWQRTP